MSSRQIVEHRHPSGLYIVFFAEMWERFSYYGMRALLIFYMTQTFLFDDDKSYGIYGSYTALVYLSPIFGGLIADRLLGYRKAVTVGAILMALGHFCMAIEQVPVFYLALALLIVGNGFFKPNMSSIVGRLYGPDDPRRDSGFTIFYMGVNLGAMLAPIACGWVGSRFGWHWGFTLAGFGMVVGLINFIVGQDRLEGKAEPPDPERLRRPVFAGLNPELLVWLGGGLAVVGTWFLIQQPTLVGWLLIGVGVLVFVSLTGFSVTRIEGAARHRMWVALVLTGFSVVFWAFFEQAGSSLNLFTQRNVDTTVMGWQVPAPVMQAINPIFILLLGGPIAAMWIRLRQIDRNPTIPLKFGLGILQLGLGFVALYYGASRAQEDGMVALGWLVLGYLLQTTGELFLSPVGLSMITKLSPANMTGVMMGTWYLSISFAQYAAGLIARLTSIDTDDGSAALPPAETVMVYGEVFGKIAVVALAVGALVTLLSPLIHRGTHGVR